ncbi:MAG: ISAs1 family transposase [Rhodobacteraceae bacterium]|nr:ISAs1 family transposase [Paracoccaceae bacterium]
MKAVTSLREALAQLPDTKQPYEYPLEGVLTLICLAMMCGQNGEREIARWAQAQRWALPERLGFPREKMPSLGTIQEALRRIPPTTFTRVVSEWAESVLQVQGASEGEGIAIDGKVVRGSRTDDQSAVHLLSALAHDLKLVLGQTPVADHTNEIGGIDPLLSDLVLEGRVVTVDAHLTQRKIAETIREKGGTT